MCSKSFPDCPDASVRFSRTDAHIVPPVCANPGGSFSFSTHICVPDVGGAPAHLGLCKYVCGVSRSSLWFLDTSRHLRHSWLPPPPPLMSRILPTLVNSCAVILNGVICVPTLVHSCGGGAGRAPLEPSTNPKPALRAAGARMAASSACSPGHVVLGV